MIKVYPNNIHYKDNSFLVYIISSAEVIATTKLMFWISKTIKDRIRTKK